MRTLTTPQVIVNNEVLSIVPNSLTYDGGEGEINVRSASGGGQNVESVHSANAEDRIGKVKFDLYLTSDLDSKIALWKENIGTNAISFGERFANGDTVTRSFDRMSLMNSVERNASADGVVSLEFEGDPMSRQ